VPTPAIGSRATLSIMKNVDDLIPTRRTLLIRLRDWNDQENWRTFFDTYWRLLYNTAIAGGLTPAEAEDAVQETVISVMKSMPTFHYDAQKGSFKNWLLKLTRWRISDQLRRRHAGLAKGGAPTGTTCLEAMPDPGVDLEASWNREWEANLLEVAVERVKSASDPRHYQIFDLLVRKKWPPAQVAAFLGITTARVYLVKHRIGALIKKEVSHLQAKPL
jgi:RNA polymerase sigma factor (sigma-70 family)